MPLILNGTTGVSGIDGSAGTPSYVGGDSDTGLWYPAANTLALSTSGSERLRIDSSGIVAIGTTTTTDAGVTITTGVTRDSSWNAKLALQSTGGNDFPVLLFSGCSATNRYGAIVQTASTSGNTPSQITAAIAFENPTSTAGNIIFATNGSVGTSTSTERMRITTGSVGIGNSIPGSFNAFANQLVVGNGSSSQGITVYASGASSISFADGTAGTAPYQGYLQYNHALDSMDFYVNYAGSTSPRMRIASNGDVLIGTTSNPGTRKVVVIGSIASTLSDANDIQLLIGADANTAFVASTYGGTGSYKPLTLNSGGSERMRIQTNGNVCINTTTAGSQLTIDVTAANYTNGIDICNSASWGYGSSINFRTIPTISGSLDTVSRIQQFYEASNQYGLSFSTYNAGLSERMRITSAGYLKVSNDGTYTNVSDSFHEVNQSANNHAWYIRANNASQTLDACQISTARNTTNNSYYALAYYNGGAGAYKFRVADSGNCTNTNGSYGTISDIKNKENIVDATPKLDKVKQLKVRNYNFKGDDLKQIGFVAQEFEQVFPSMVEEHSDRDAEGNDLGTTTKSIKTSVLVPILVKAIQEQQAMIEELTNRIKKIEGV